jgi:hypothetical protein
VGEHSFIIEAAGERSSLPVRIPQVQPAVLSNSDVESGTQFFARGKGIVVPWHKMPGTSRKGSGFASLHPTSK